MYSLRQNPVSRANRKLSRGPVTERGKANSSRNALRHGFFSKSALLHDESSAAFRKLHHRYTARFAPSGIAEQRLLNQMVAARWRLRRLWALETHVFDEALAAQPPGGEIVRLAGALQALASSPKLALIHRYEARLQSLYRRALRAFLQLRTPDMRNEPTS
jgi:hypothetical protein